MPKILMLDIETAPLTAYVWGMWKQNVGYNQLEHEWYILTWAAKWLDDRKVQSARLSGYDLPPQSDTVDKDILEPLWTLLDEADIVVAHNGRRFDVPKINARFLKCGFNPPSPFKQIDTLAEAKKTFRFTSNRLDALAKHLGVGKKMDTGGFELWKDCIHGSEKALAKMLKYNIQDIKILEDVYLAMRPWMPNHPNLGVYIEGEKHVCPKCSSEDLQRRGFQYTQVGKYQRFQCLSCGGWSKSRFTENAVGVRKALLNNAG